MTPPAASSPTASWPRGFGALVTTVVEHADLGTHATHRLTGRVERRQLRLAFGRRGRFRLTLGRARPVAVEVTQLSGAGARYELPIAAGAAPWAAAAGRVLWWWGVAATAVVIIRRLRARGQISGRGPDAIV